MLRKRMIWSERNAGYGWCRNKKSRVLAVLALAFTLGGCAGASQEPVIAPKASEERIFDTGSSQMEETDHTAGRLTVRGQTAAPERYQTRIDEEWLAMDADAEVVMPDAEVISSVVLEKPDYSREDYERLLSALEKATKKEWGEAVQTETKAAGCLTADSLDGTMRLTFMTGEDDPMQTPMFWATSCVYSRASDDSFDSSNLSELQMTEEEQLSVEEQVERKAEDLLVDMGLNGFLKYRSEWKRLRVYEINNGVRTLEETGDYSLWLRYKGSYGNVPIADISILGSMGEIPLCKTQYVDLLYTCEGELLELKNIGLDTYGAEKEEEFFLPFESVTQIFEQYCRTFYTEERVNEMMGTGISMDGGKLHGRFHITVDDVRLEYRPVYPERKSDQEERLESGILTPVWNFYGKTEWNPVQKTEGEGSTASLPQQLLLSVNACDGQVYGR